MYYDPTGHDPVKVIVEYKGYNWAATIDNGVTTMADGSRPPAGAIVHTKDGDYVAQGGNTPGVRVGTTSSGSGSGGNTGNGSGNSSVSGSGGARGVDFGPNEGADWLRTGSGLSFEEFWGVTANGATYYNGSVQAPNRNTTNSTGSNEAGLWMYGTFTKNSDLIISSYGQNTGQSTPNVAPWTTPYNPAQQQVGGIFLLGKDDIKQQILDELQKLTDHTLAYDKETGKVYIFSYAKDSNIKYAAGNELITRIVLNSTEYIVNIQKIHPNGDNRIFSGKHNSSILFNPDQKYAFPSIDPSTGNVKKIQMDNLGYVMLAHELIHADRRMRDVSLAYLGTETWKYPSGQFLGIRTYKTQRRVSKEDLAAIGLKYNDGTMDITENMIRAEHTDDNDVPLPLRGGY